MRNAVMLMALLAAVSYCASAQNNNKGLYKVLTLDRQNTNSNSSPGGLNNIYQLLLKLRTTGSVLTIQAHPDDEEADLLTYLSRGKGVRTAILSLNRGESGSNLLGTEAFDQLGLLRTEEFILAARYYGLDDLYFTNLVDYGYSKRVDEAYDKWGKENLLAEMVRAIRINRPLVIVSRFHGSERDGHGNHQAAGEASPEAYRLAADPKAFPDQITKEGLRPWKAKKLYRGGVTENETWQVSLNTGMYCPWLGDSYINSAMRGYSFHRSQFGGQLIAVNGNFIRYYERRGSPLPKNPHENGFFDGLDTSISGIYKLTGETTPAGAEVLLKNIQQSVNKAFLIFQPGKLNELIAPLTVGLRDTRKLISLSAKQPEAKFILLAKEQQFMDAIIAILGTSITATAVPINAKQPAHFYEQPVLLNMLVPGQAFKVMIQFTNNSVFSINSLTLELDKQVKDKAVLKPNETFTEIVALKVPDNAPFSKPWYTRKSIQENNYQCLDSGSMNLPRSNFPYVVNGSFFINGEKIYFREPVQSLHSKLPYGYDSYPLKIGPAIAVNLQPLKGILIKGNDKQTVSVSIELVSNADTSISGDINLQIPSGWQATPSSYHYSFSNAGERQQFSFSVTTTPVGEQTYSISATATANGKIFSQGYSLSTHRDLDETLLYSDAVSQLKGIDVSVTSGLRIGYVMGAGDEVPACIRQLGAQVELLESKELANGNLDSFNVIVIGTRAYAVRTDLNEYNGRLLDFAKKGGHLVVLFQTPEFVPERMAPFTAHLPDNPEEVAEEDSPVTILRPGHPVFNYPNKITVKDFDNWVEQRGSKFFSSWDSAYTAMIVTNDKGQSPQSGGWLMAAYGKGTYTYFAYALHRQLPNSVPGAYRLLANLLSYGKAK